MAFKGTFSKSSQCADGLWAKDKLRTRREASQVKRRLQRRTGAKFDAYLCPHCGYYHVGHAKLTEVEEI